MNSLLLPEAIRIHRSAECGNSDSDALAESIALALMGAADLADATLAETASWERSEKPSLVGRDAIQSAREDIRPPAEIWLEEVVTHGKAGAVSGRYSPDGAEMRLFCHVIRFTTSAAREVAQLVSFERRERRNG